MGAIAKAFKVIGLTGGIGSGKSLVAEMVRENGLTVISADAFARELTEPGSPVLDQIARDIGQESITKDGSLNRRWLRQKISVDPSTRQRLEAILHPAIQKRAQTEIESLRKAGKKIVVYEIPLLFEVKSSLVLDAAIGIASPVEKRVQRIVARDGVSIAEAKSMIAIQMNADKKMSLCDYVIDNSGTETELRSAVDQAVLWIKNRTKN